MVPNRTFHLPLNMFLSPEKLLDKLYNEFANWNRTTKKKLVDEGFSGPIYVKSGIFHNDTYIFVTKQQNI